MKHTGILDPEPTTGHCWQFRKGAQSCGLCVNVGDVGISFVEHSQLLSVSEHLGDGDGQGSLACCSPRGRKELDMTERPN